MPASDIPRDPESMIGMPSPLLDIRSRTFATVRRGYDRAEVDAFLKRLAETMSELLEERTMLSADAVIALDPEAIAESTAVLEDAEARASRRLHAATLEADRLRTEARRTLDKAIKEAQEVENAARANAEQITNEAAEMRQQILRDLLRRRKEAQTHVEMLRAARDELLNVFNQVRRITAQVKDPLDSALDRAKQAADAAAKRAQEEPQESLTQFEAELQTARLSGVIPVPAEAEQSTVDNVLASPEIHEEASPVADAVEPVAVSEPVEAAEAAEPPAEPIVETASVSEAAAEPAAEPETLAPELDDIFARLRETASESAESAEPDRNSKPEQDEPSEKPAKSSKKRASRKKASKKSPGKTAAAAETSESEKTPENAASDDLDEHVSSEELPDDGQLEDLKRQIRRALTTDESRVLQAIHRLHNKAPKKAEELSTVLLNQDVRTAEFAELLPVSQSRIQSLLVVPLSSSLSACDIAESDTKILVQQVRDVYRSFSQEQIATAAAELAKHAETAE